MPTKTQTTDPIADEARETIARCEAELEQISPDLAAAQERFDEAQARVRETHVDRPSNPVGVTFLAGTQRRSKFSEDDKSAARTAQTEARRALTPLARQHQRLTTDLRAAHRRLQELAVASQAEPVAAAEAAVASQVAAVEQLEAQLTDLDQQHEDAQETGDVERVIALEGIRTTVRRRIELGRDGVRKAKIARVDARLAELAPKLMVSADRLAAARIAEKAAETARIDAHNAHNRLNGERRTLESNRVRFARGGR